MPLVISGEVLCLIGHNLHFCFSCFFFLAEYSKVWPLEGLAVDFFWGTKNLNAPNAKVSRVMDDDLKKKKFPTEKKTKQNASEREVK